MAETITAVRLSKEIIESARNACDLQTRSIAGQIEHWARLGRAIEAAPRAEKAMLDHLLYRVDNKLRHSPDKG
ncbi:MAG: hypothetical protein FD163_391 [Hyphomonadaceae bacterium]|nr:MAG: hypothetical protein FD128_6 [Hyphomonadaceae bacterium]KAF0187116.1 MAG: hypothetical protein FD163_391 [Hyphomonadaceae bacterium]